MRRTLEAVFWVWLGCWSNKVANSHPSPGAFNRRVLRSCLVPQCLHPPHWPCHQRRLAIMTGCLRPTPADNLHILAGIQPAELRRKGTTLSLARRAMEPGHLLHSALTCPRVGMQGVSNPDTHLCPPHNNSSFHLTKITSVRRSGSVADWGGMNGLPPGAANI